MAEEGKVETTLADGVATVRFGHPKSNSLPGSLLNSLAESIAAAGADSDAKVIVLASAEPGPFCAGASFAELQSIRTTTDGSRFFMGFAKVILAIRRAPKFVIGRIHGKAVGGGVGLVAACDYTVAVKSASVRLSELALGIGPFVVGPAVERRLGSGAFSGMSIDADWRDAAWAHQRGLYTVLTEDQAGLDSALGKLTDTLKGSSPDAMIALKQALWEGTEHWEKLLPARAEISGRLVLSDWSQAAIAKLAEKQR